MSSTKDSQRFLEAMKLIVSVPKTEMDRREAEYRKARKAKKEAKAREREDAAAMRRKAEQDGAPPAAESDEARGS